MDGDQNNKDYGDIESKIKTSFSDVNGLPDYSDNSSRATFNNMTFMLSKSICNAFDSESQFLEKYRDKSFWINVSFIGVSLVATIVLAFIGAFRENITLGNIFSSYIPLVVTLISLFGNQTKFIFDKNRKDAFLNTLKEILRLTSINEMINNNKTEIKD